MKYRRISCLLLILIFAWAAALPQTGNRLPYKNPNLTIDERVRDLLGRMTLEEKSWQLFMIPGDLDEGKEKYKHGIFGFQIATKGKQADPSGQLLDSTPTGTAREVAEKINAIQKYFVEETRLGIPIIPFDEALHGLAREGATVFPQAIALAATWNAPLVEEVARAIARETGSRGIRQALSPVLNIARDPRWGRVEETYGEDPYLTTMMGLAFIRPFEKAGIVTTPKHFAANFGDGGRDSYPIHHNERLMEEIYFPAFKAAVQKGGARSIMASYNSVDGVPATASRWLLTTKLKREWGFEGFVISDASATGGSIVLHHTAPNYPVAAKDAIEAGLDVIFQTAYDHHRLFREAFQKGMTDERAINEAVARVLRVKFELGLFEKPYVDPDEAARWNGNPDHRRLALRAARESIVLLKNENRLLPLKKSLQSVAVIGTDATEARMGGYSGPGIKKVSILDGIRNKLGPATDVRYVPGCGREARQYTPVPPEHLVSISDGKRRQGLKGEYFDNIKLEGRPRVTRIDPKVDFGWTLYSPARGIPYDWYSAAWTGKLIAPSTGTHRIGIEGNDGYRLYLDGKLLIDNWKKQSYRAILKEVELEAGKEYDLRLEFFESTGNARLKLVWDYGVKGDWKVKIEEAVALARLSDAVILVAGLEEGEFRDRAYLNLPGHQEEMILAVAATGKPLVVVLTGGSAITMNSWLDRVDGVLYGWYPGEEGGNAMADVLFGDYNPAARLPITFPISEAQLPLYYNHKPTGRGDDYLNLTGQPLFPFGFGLSYSEFEYSGLAIEPSEIEPSGTALVRFKVKNVSTRAGDEVVQLYLRDVLASVARPIMELKGFQRIHLNAGEEKEATFELTPEHLGLLNRRVRCVVEPGAFRVMIGRSSKDIRLRGALTVK
ncbi:MAG: glycoside hydrolase family 3 C-terminal domain-containing protein [Blastocatellia bacterium]|nr:glycoside hydrolase family 3 C-terminal domain-containing protein [Blastocatellia bacterium]